MYLNRETISRN